MNYFNISCPRKSCGAGVGEKCRDRSGKKVNAHSARKFAYTGKTAKQRQAERQAKIDRKKAYRAYIESHPEIPTAFETNKRKH